MFWTGAIFFLLGILAMVLACTVGVQPEGVPTPVTPVPSPTTKNSAYLASAARGDFLSVEIQENQIVYKNLTNGVSGTAVNTIDSDGYLTFGNDPNIQTGLIAPGIGVLLQVTSAGPSKTEKGFALGLVTSPFDSAVFPQKVFNYMQFRTNNGGYEVGYIDAGTQVKHQYCSPSQSRYGLDGSPGTGNIQDGVQSQSDFQIDASTFSLSEDRMYLSKVMPATENDPEETISIFKTVDDDLVIDLNNGSIFACQVQADDTKPSGKYMGLLFGKNNAQSMEDNTEIGDDQLTKVTITFTEDSFSWVDGEDTFTGTIQPLHEVVNMENQMMHGLFYSRVMTELGSLMDFCFIKGQNGKLLCAYFNQPLNVPLSPPPSPPPPPNWNNVYHYRHGAAFLQT
jgi:hypothetical protein